MITKKRLERVKWKDFRKLAVSLTGTSDFEGAGALR